MPIPLNEFVEVNLNLQEAGGEQFDFSTPLGVFDHSATSNRIDGPYASIDEVVSAGFTTGAEPEVHAWASSVFSQDKRPKKLNIGRKVTAENWTVTMDAILADRGPDAFYLFNAETRAEADHLLIAAWSEAQSSEAPKVYIGQTSDAAVLAGTAGNVLLDLQALAYDRTALIYHQYDDSTGGLVATDGYLDAAWLSRCAAFDLDAAGGRGTWSFKKLKGVTGDDYNSTQATNVYDANGNVYGTSKSRTFTSKGTVASGKFIDVVTSLDWGRVRIGEAMIDAFLNEDTVIPFTNEGLNRVASVSQRVLELGVRNGHFSPDAPRTVSTPTVSEISASDKASRKVTVTGEVTLAGGIHSVTYNISVLQ